LKNEEEFCNVKEQIIILHTIKGKKDNWIGPILRKNCILKHIFEGKIEGGTVAMGRRGRRKQLLNDLQEKRRY
jgi:hypothetical protein